jgi:hypothetical protein
MASRQIINEYEREMLIARIKQHKLPFTVDITPGRHRSVEQNKLQRLWMKEIADELGDTPEHWRGYCKLTIGVPILRQENDDFRAKYDAAVRPLPYLQKLAIMSEPLDLPVTRLMTTVQKTAYLDRVFRHFSEQGVVLTIPPEKFRSAA